VHLVLGLCVVTVIVALLPGRRIYDDANNCFRNGLAELANTESHGGHCEPSYTRVRETRSAGGWSAIFFVVAVALGAGMVLGRPTRASAIGFAIWTALISAAIALFNFQIFGDVEVRLWPSHVLTFAVGTLLVLVLIAAPLVAFVTRERSSDSLPAARDSTGSR
jgi:hypothetical protein